MKLLFDLFPVILFFMAYKAGSSNPEVAAQLALTLLGGVVADGQVPAAQAPILLATAVAIVASLLQVGLRVARRQKVEPMLWLSFAVILVFGGATIWLHDETFIKWKPTILYWLFGLILLGGRLLWRRNLLQGVLGAQIAVVPRVWEQLLWLWVVFFAAIGALNLVVAFNFPTDLWVNFKLFGLFGLTLVFTLGIGIWLARHMKEVPDA
ncbi:MAG TPA: septation protein A [Burkholderiaceae bacterium]|nr:septation protein A [Burkholderiaceae bacterium]